MRIFGLGIARTTFVPPAFAGWSRLLTCARGSVLVRTPGSTVAVFGDRGLFLSETSPEIVARGQADIRILHTRLPARPGAVVRVTRLLSEIVERMVERGYLDPRVEPDRRILEVAADEYDGLRDTDARLALDHPAGSPVAFLTALWTTIPAPSVLEAASLLGCSTRTLARLFSNLTGVGAATWRRRCVLTAAIAQIAAGASVTEAALDADYATASAFIGACRREYGRTPHAFLRRTA